VIAHKMVQQDWGGQQSSRVCERGLYTCSFDALRRNL